MAASDLPVSGAAYVTLQGTGYLLGGQGSVKVSYSIDMQHRLEERSPLPPILRSQAWGVMDSDQVPLISLPESQNPRLRLQDGKVVKIRFISGNHFTLMGEPA